MPPAPRPCFLFAAVRRFVGFSAFAGFGCGWTWRRGESASSNGSGSLSLLTILCPYREPRTLRERHLHFDITAGGQPLWREEDSERTYTTEQLVTDCVNDHGSDAEQAPERPQPAEVERVVDASMAATG